METVIEGKLRFCIDRGGTFTDVYAEIPGHSDGRVLKLLSVDPSNYDDAPVDDEMDLMIMKDLWASILKVLTLFSCCSQSKEAVKVLKKRLRSSEGAQFFFGCSVSCFISSTMDIDFTNPFSSSPNFTDLLNSQQEINTPEPFFQTQSPLNQPHLANKRSTAQRWSVPEEKVLVGAWLNTSKDAVVGNEQKGGAFWQRVADLYGANPIVAKQIYFQDQKMKFTLEHVWRLLRNDQKWCELLTEKTSPSSKRAKVSSDGMNFSSSSQTGCPVEEKTEERPLGVKSSKAKEKKRGKGKSEETDGRSLKVLEEVWVMKKEDFIIKERLSKQKILDSLILKTQPLSEGELILKEKLIIELCNEIG